MSLGVRLLSNLISLSLLKIDKNMYVVVIKVVRVLLSLTNLRGLLHVLKIEHERYDINYDFTRILNAHMYCHTWGDLVSCRVHAGTEA